VPIYEYRCSPCGQEFQKLVSGQSEVACPSCRSPEVRRTLSIFGIRGGSAAVAAERTGGTCCGAGGCGCH
jgi:putative FmdB family regulatory protein